MGIAMYVHGVFHCFFSFLTIPTVDIQAEVS